MRGDQFPIPDRKEALEVGAALVEHELHKLRARAQEIYEQTREARGDEWDGRTRPITSSHEMDLMQAVHLATAAATLTAMAREEST